MRMMLRAEIPVERGNQAVKDGSLAQTFQRLTEQLKPEAAYFYAENGKRAFMMVFDMTGSMDIPAIAEPLFSNLDASIELQPVMNSEDLKAGFEKLPS